MSDRAGRNGRILCIIPAYNESGSVGDVVRGVRRRLADVLVIDDHSTDDTAEEARQAGARVASLPVNLGYAGALQTGYMVALREGYDFVVQMDADGQHLPEDIPKLLAPVLSSACDIAIASRYLSDSTYKTSFCKRLGQQLFAAIAGFYTKRTVTDPTSGFQAMTRAVFTEYARGFFPDDYPDADLLIAVSRMGFRSTEVGVRMNQCNGRSMHDGAWKALYYIYKMTLAIYISVTCKLPTRR